MPDKAKLQKKPSNSGGAVQMHIGQPAVNVRVPEIKVPQINVPESNVTVDIAPLADAIESLAIAMNQLAQQQATILREIADSRNLLAEVAKNAPNVEVQAPIVKLPTRPRSYSVEIEDEKGDVTTMTIAANSPN